jgi:hypothetical protein
MTDIIEAIPVHSEGGLLGVIDRLLEHGVVVQGDLEISVAGVDLLSVGLKVFLASIDKAEMWKRGVSVPDEILIVLIAPAFPASEVKLSGREFLARRRAGNIADATLVARLKWLAEDHGGRLDPVEGRDLGGELRIVVRIRQEQRVALLAALAADLPALTVSTSGPLAGAGT